MQIKDPDLDFGSLSSRGSTNRIIIHHAEAQTCSPWDIHNWHLGNGWSGAGYHFLVRKDGSVWSLRPEWAVGAHAAGSNSDSLGICFEGCYGWEDMPEAQLQAGRELLAHLKGKYGIDLVQAHRDVCDTDCPGDNFPFDELVSGKAANVSGNAQPDTNPVNDMGLWYRAHVEDYGWLGAVHDGQTAGTTGRAKRLEAIKVTPPQGVTLKAKAHIENVGWVEYDGIKRGESSGEGSSQNDPIIGTVGKKLRLEAIAFEVTENSTGKELYFDVHQPNVGWTGWQKAGTFTGTVGHSERIEAIRMKMV